MLFCFSFLVAPCPSLPTTRNLPERVESELLVLIHARHLLLCTVPSISTNHLPISNLVLRTPNPILTRPRGCQVSSIFESDNKQQNLEGGGGKRGLGLLLGYPILVPSSQQIDLPFGEPNSPISFVSYALTLITITNRPADTRASTSLLL